MRMSKLSAIYQNRKEQNIKDSFTLSARKVNGHGLNFSSFTLGPSVKGSIFPFILGNGRKLHEDIDDSAMKDFKLICNKGIEYKILDGMKYFDVECWAKIANVSGTGKVRVYIQ